MLDADTLLERHLNARGGLRAILNIRTLYQCGTVTGRKGSVVDIEGWRMRPDRLRIQFKTGENIAVEGWDGQRGWAHVPWKSPEPYYIDDTTFDSLRYGAEFDGPLVQDKQKGHRIESLGECVVAGLPVYGLRVILRDGSTVDHYLHKESYMVAMTEAMRPLHVKNPSATVTQYTDYRLVSGVMFPHYWVETADGGNLHETFAWREIMANQPLDINFFVMPSAVPSGN
jgi:hypothetical protein